MNLSKYDSICLVLENCEVIELNISDIEHFYTGDVSESFYINAGKLCKSRSLSGLYLAIKKDVNLSHGNELSDFISDGKPLQLDRLKYCDVTQIIFSKKGGSFGESFTLKGEWNESGQTHIGQSYHEVKSAFSKKDYVIFVSESENFKGIDSKEGLEVWK